MDEKPLFGELTRAVLGWSAGPVFGSFRSAFRSRRSVARDQGGVEEYKRLMDSGLRPSHMLRRKTSDTTASLVLCRETKRP